MTLRQKLSLPAPQWIIFGLILLIIIGTVKLVVWLVPLLTAAVVKLAMWITPIAWQAIISVAALVCAMATLAWRLRKQRKLYEDVIAGTVIIYDAEYTVG